MSDETKNFIVGLVKPTYKLNNQEKYLQASTILHDSCKIDNIISTISLYNAVGGEDYTKIDVL